VGGGLLFPPPQPQSNRSTANGKRRNLRVTVPRAPPGSTIRPIKPMAHIHPGFERDGTSSAELRAIVVTLTLKVEGVVAFTLAVAGMKQVAAMGTPVQLREAVPVMPCPPMLMV
jgi:hypothetical protein